MDISKSPFLESFGKECPNCGVPVSTVPMVYENGEPIKPVEGWINDDGIKLQCGCCAIQEAEDGSIFFVPVAKVYAPAIWEAVKQEAAEINEKCKRKTGEKEWYYVVFRHTGKTGGYQGVRFIVPYSSEEDFEKHNTPESREIHEVVAAGISEERVHELARETPTRCYIASAIQDAIGQDGEFYPGIFEMQIASILHFLKPEKREEAIALLEKFSAERVIKGVDE